MIDNGIKAVIKYAAYPARMGGTSYCRRAHTEVYIMKKFVALLLALAMLLGGASALAQSYGSRFDLSSIRISLLGSRNENVARLHGVTLTVVVGSTDGIPTMQLTLRYGDSQQTDAIAQIVDNQLVASVGGINGTFYADLDAIFGPGQGYLMTKGLSLGLLMVGSKPRSMLQLVLPIDDEGVYKKHFAIPVDQYRGFIEPLIRTLENTDTLREEDEQTLREAIPQGSGDMDLSVRYNPNSDSLRIKITQDGKGVYLRGTLLMSTEPMDMDNISKDEVKYNLLDLDEDVAAEMRDELAYMGFKLDSFVKNSNMRKLKGN